jgi:outer membrane protein TolC
MSFAVELTGKSRLPALAVALAVLAGCATKPYVAAPLDAAAVAASVSQRGLSEPGLRDFMARHGHAGATWPPARWDLAGLTLAAIYFHPDVAVARAEWDVARAAETTAARRLNPGVSPEIAYHGDQNPGEDGPWSLGFAIDIPLVTGDVREARMERARALSEAARLAIADAAWRVRARLRARFVACHGAERAIVVLDAVAAARREVTTLFETRYAMGEASAAEMHRARTRLGEAELALTAGGGRVHTARAELAEALGLPVEAVDRLALAYAALDALGLNLAGDAVRRAALLNRLDLRAALARYAAAEAALRVEIERQYPTVTLSPGWAFDQGDLVWSLASDLLAPLFDRNQGPIAEAEARRALVATRFTALQTRVLSELNRAVAHHRAQASAWRTAEEARVGAADRFAQVSRQVAHGESGRLTLVEARLTLLAAELAVLEQRLGLLRAWGAVEDAVQRPLDGTPFPANLEAPARSS